MDFTYPIAGNQLKRLQSRGDGTVAEVVALGSLAPSPWSSDTPFDATLYPDVEVQIVGTPTTPYIFQDSLDGVSWNDCMVGGRLGQQLASVTTAGIYRLPGSHFVKTRQGAGASAIIRCGAIGTPALANSLVGSDGNPVDFSAPAQTFVSATSLTLAGLWSTAAASTYLAANATDPTGFDISMAQGVSVTFEGTYAGQNVVPEQTNDPSGASGWYPISGQRWFNDGSSTPNSGGNAFSTTGNTWTFPVYGVRMRLRVSALTSGTISARVALLNAQPERSASVAVLRPTTAGGVSVARVTTGNSGVIKSGAGQLYGWEIANTNAARRYLQLYAKATAPVIGTDTPVMTIPIPPSGDKSQHNPIGIAFYPAIAWAVTTDAAGATAGASGDTVFSVLYA
ncbi:hypothetical protein [Novosphingobium sp.]|uniref:hypothetical protein n=1 Tax=Novosphingobium sp. TaxID=1874826 RepID=UPI0038B92891